MADEWADFRAPASDPWAEFRAAPTPSGGEITADIAKSAGIGVVKGGVGLAGLPGDAMRLIQASFDRLGLQRANNPNAQFLPGSGDLTQRLESLTGQLYQPKTTAGEYAQTAGEFLPAVLGGPESLAARLANRVAIPAAGAETASQLTKGTEAEPWARLAGGLGAARFAAPAAARAVTPLPASAERTALANTLRQEGVDLTAGQATGSRPLQWAESALGDMPGAGGRAAAVQARQGEQFTAAALARAGETANRATPAVIDQAFTRIGNQFDTLATRNTLNVDRQLGTDLGAAERDYNGLVSPSQRAPVVADTITDIRGMGSNITGQQFNALSSRLARQARGAAADPQLSGALRDIRESLHDAMERSINRSGNMADVAAWRTARDQYRNLLVLEKAATGPGAATAEGLISPSQLRTATVGQNRRAYARGQGDLADLARAGEAIMKPLPQSGTGPRVFMQTLGGLAGHTAGGLAGALPGMLAPGMAGRALMSRPVQGYLGNQAAMPLNQQNNMLQLLRSGILGSLRLR